MRYTIQADNNDQGWLDAFNNYMGYEYNLGDEIPLSNVEHMTEEINIFNNEYAHGPAIQLEGADE